MAQGDQYRIKAAKFHAEANHETRPVLRRSLESLARAYLRLAGQADRNAETDVVYEPPCSGNAERDQH
jgi:hypothetical protein